jgi:hypothetical protein
MSQLWGMKKNLALSEIANLLAKLVPSFASKERCMPVWYAAPLVVNEGTHFWGEDTMALHGLNVE